VADEAKGRNRTSQEGSRLKTSVKGVGNWSAYHAEEKPSSVRGKKFTVKGGKGIR